MDSNTEKLLVDHGIRPTAIRTLVLRNIGSLPEVFTLADAEELMESVDRSTLFRTLELFTEGGLLHVDTAGGVKKYCLCTCHDHSHHKETHIHATCRICGQTFCIKHFRADLPPLPEGFRAEQVAYTVEGVCAKCGGKIHE